MLQNRHGLHHCKQPMHVIRAPAARRGTLGTQSSWHSCCKSSSTVQPKCSPGSCFKAAEQPSITLLERRHLLQALGLSFSTKWLLPAAAPAANLLSTQLFTDPGRFRVLVPTGWQQVQVLPGTSILGSWYDPVNRGSDVLAVYAAATPLATTADLGSAKEVGESLAAISPGGMLHQWGRDTRGGRQYITTQVLFTGVSAGSFGAVVDIRCSVVAQGQKYTLRVSSKAANISSDPAWYDTINQIVASFQVLV